MKKLSMIALEKDKEFVLLKGERDALKLELDSARGQLLSATEGQFQEIENLRSKVAKLRSELESSQQAKRGALEDLAILKQKYDALVADCDRNNATRAERDKKFEVCNDRNMSDYAVAYATPLAVWS
jgi:chromosome segregation ATPase